MQYVVLRPVNYPRPASDLTLARRSLLFVYRAGQISPSTLRNLTFAKTHQPTIHHSSFLVAQQRHSLLPRAFLVRPDRHPDRLWYTTAVEIREARLDTFT